MVVTSIKVVELLLVIPMCFSDGVRGSNFALPKIFVNTVLVDIHSRNNQRSVFVALSLHTSVGVVLPPIGLLPCGSAKVDVSEDKVSKACAQLLFEYHVRLCHA